MNLIPVNIRPMLFTMLLVAGLASSSIALAADTVTASADNATSTISASYDGTNLSYTYDGHGAFSPGHYTDYGFVMAGHTTGYGVLSTFSDVFLGNNTSLSGTVVKPYPAGTWIQIRAQAFGTGEHSGLQIKDVWFQVGHPPTEWDVLDQHRLNKNTKDDPVQLATGNEVHHRVLFKFSGARNWEFTINYNSLHALTPFGPLQMGRGWSHNFEAKYGAAASGVFTSVSLDNFTRCDFAPASTTDPNLLVSAADASRYNTLTLNPGVSALLTHRDQSSQLFDAADFRGLLLEDRDAQGRKLNLGYNANGQLTSITEPISGPGLTLSYDTDGKLQTLTDTTGATVQLSYSGITSGDKVLSQITNQNGKITTFSYDSNAQLISVADDAGQVLLTNTNNPALLVSVSAQADGVPGHQPSTYTYVGISGGGRTTTYTDHNGKQSVHTFDSELNMTSEKNALNQTTSYTYDVFNQLTSVTDPLSHTTSYTNDTIGNVLTSTDPAGKVTTFTYDSRNNLLTTTDPLAQVTTRTYDSNNNLLAVTDALGRTTSWTYDANSLPLTMTLPGGGVYHYTYTAGRLTTATDPNGVATNFGYDVNGRLLYREDALGQRVTFTYDTVGNVLTVTNALSQAISYAYDHNSRVISMTDATGAVTGYVYDNNSKLRTLTDALGKATTYTYDGEDRLTTVRDALNRTTTYNYDDAGRLNSVVDPASNTTAYEYDAADQLTAVIDALGKRTTAAYDVRGLITGIIDPLNHSSSFAYDDVPRWTSATDPLNRVIGFEYDALDRIKKVTAPGGLVAEQGFDSDGNSTSLKNPANNSTTFAYDAGGRLTATTTSEGHATSYTYNSRGLPESEALSSGYTMAFGYDDAQRLSSTTDPIGTITLGRDAHGRVLTVVEGSRTLTRVYDALGRLTSYTDGDGNVISYTYDDIGRLTKLTYPGTPLKEVTYAYDIAGRLSTVTDWASRVTTYSYDAVGRMTQLLRPNGTKQVRTYDDAGRLTYLTELAPDGTTILYNGSHSYDAAGQLTGENIYPGITPAGVSTTQTFSADNRLLTHNGAATTFDADGNLLSVASGLTPSAYSYDARNRLTAAGGLTYGYNAEYRRTSVTDGTGTTSYVINPNAVLDQVLVRTAPGGTKTFYVYGLGLLNEETGSTVRYYHHDRRGDTIALTDGTGAITDRVNYGVYGELLSRTGTTNTPFLFNGKWGVQTDTSGVYYHRARYYHPALRRFLNQDTLLGSIGSSASLNRFAFVANDPINGIDPLGFDTYLINRDLAKFGDSAASRSNPITHTFTLTTNPDGSIKHTYSWGNDANLKGWNLDQPLDRKTGREALDKELAEKVGDKSLDPFIHKAYDELNNKDNEHYNWIVYSNCKTESSKLVDRAKKLQTIK